MGIFNVFIIIQTKNKKKINVHLIVALDCKLVDLSKDLFGRRRGGVGRMEKNTKISINKSVEFGAIFDCFKRY